jgi:glutamate N-acetyltransferase/amino-acid N-acetyltransferase
MKHGIALASGNLSADNGLAAAQAIMTTDTKPKHYGITYPGKGGMVTIGGITKGSGMIHPNMATMLAIITTDAAIPAGLLSELLDDVVDKSFNCISVDGDTSTNDTVLLLANGASGIKLDNNVSVDVFLQALTAVCSDLATKIVRDGEGATKFVEIRVTGAAEERYAKQIAETIAVSPLVKTALAGSDPNWGRIIMAAGRAGVSLNPAKLRLSASNPGTTPLTIVDNGTPTDYDESDAVAIFEQSDIVLQLDLGLGEEKAVMWTTDLTHQYVSINADYRT